MITTNITSIADTTAAAAAITAPLLDLHLAEDMSLGSDSLGLMVKAVE